MMSKNEIEFLTLEDFECLYDNADCMEELYYFLIDRYAIVKIGDQRHPDADNIHLMAEGSTDFTTTNHNILSPLIRNFLYQKRFTNKTIRIMESQYLMYGHVGTQYENQCFGVSDFLTEDEVEEDVYRWVKLANTTRERI
jgi:hypothetical protein